jgi:hypothetical protein
MKTTFGGVSLMPPEISQVGPRAQMSTVDRNWSRQ